MRKSNILPILIVSFFLMFPILATSKPAPLYTRRVARMDTPSVEMFLKYLSVPQEVLADLSPVQKAFIYQEISLRDGAAYFANHQLSAIDALDAEVSLLAFYLTPHDLENDIDQATEMLVFSSFSIGATHSPQNNLLFLSLNPDWILKPLGQVSIDLFIGYPLNALAEDGYLLTKIPDSQLYGGMRSVVWRIPNRTSLSSHNSDLPFQAFSVITIISGSPDSARNLNLGIADISLSRIRRSSVSVSRDMAGQLYIIGHRGARVEYYHYDLAF